MSTRYIAVAVTDDDVKCLLSALARLAIAVKETKVVELNVEQADRLEQAQFLVGTWDNILRKKAEIARLEAEAATPR